MSKRRCLIVYPLVNAEDTVFQKEFLREFRMLISAIGIHSVGERKFDLKRKLPATLISKYRMEQLAAEATEKDAEMLAFMGTLSPTQKFNLEEYFGPMGIFIIDREETIIEIFHEHAKTSEAKLQVELARLKYLLPRLKGRNDLSRLGAGIGTRGPGEQTLEYEKRTVLKRISAINKRIKKLSVDYSEQGKQRKGLFQAALCGYANSGKTTVLNSLAKFNSKTMNKPFTTLDTLVKKSWVGGENILVVDTIGFIRNLPKGLELAFKTTMNILNQVDLIILLYDLSARDLGIQMETVESHLEKILDEKKQVLTVFNKLDLRSARDRHQAFSKRFPEGVFISGKTGEGLSQFKAILKNYKEKVK